MGDTGDNSNVLHVGLDVDLVQDVELDLPVLDIKLPKRVSGWVAQVRVHDQVQVYLEEARVGADGPAGTWGVSVLK